MRWPRDGSSDVCSPDLEPLVAGNVDEGDLTGAGQVGPGVAELDGQAASALLSEPVRVGARESSNQCGLAVVHVPGGGDDVHQDVSAAAAPRRAAAGSGRREVVPGRSEEHTSELQ